MRLIERFYRFLPDSAAVHAEWRRLLVAHNVAGVQVHDANLFSGDQIDDGEPSHAEGDAGGDVQSFGVGPAMDHALAHRVQQFFRALLRRRASIKIGPTCYATHDS